MGVDKANPKPEFPVPPEPTTGSLIVPRPSPEGAISKALCPDCAFPCGQAPSRGLRTLAQPPLRLGGRLPERICPVGPLSNRHDGCGFGVRPGQHCHSPLIVPMRYARCRVAVWDALPLAPGRTGRTATRSRAYWSHCHSPLIVPMRYARCRVAVWAALPLAPERATPYVHRRVAVYGALPRTLIAERQCTACRQVRIINVFQPPKRLDGVLPHAGLSPEELQELPLAMHAQLPEAPMPYRSRHNRKNRSITRGSSRGKHSFCVSLTSSP